MSGNPMYQRWGKLYRLTPSEAAFEPVVAALGVPYRVQHPLWLFPPHLRYFPDFVLLNERIVIEVDDHSHARKAVEDAVRTADLEADGWRVVRLTNEEAVDPAAGVILRTRLDALPASRPPGPTSSRFEPTAPPRSPPGSPVDPTDGDSGPSAAPVAPGPRPPARSRARRGVPRAPRPSPRTAASKPPRTRRPRGTSRS